MKSPLWAPTRWLMLGLTMLSVAVGPSARAFDGPGHPPRRAPSRGLPVDDLTWQPGGRIAGVLLGASGLPRGSADVVLFHDGQPLAETSTNDQGEFQFAVQKAGLYAIVAQNEVRLCRVWAPGTAPPVARDRMLFVTSEAAVRGSLPSRIYSGFEKRPYLSYTLVAAAIAVPVILFTQDDDDAS